MCLSHMSEYVINRHSDRSIFITFAWQWNHARERQMKRKCQYGVQSERATFYQAIRLRKKICEQLKGKQHSNLRHANTDKWPERFEGKSISHLIRPTAMAAQTTTMTTVAATTTPMATIVAIDVKFSHFKLTHIVIYVGLPSTGHLNLFTA